jgi:hypothetical protein
MAYQGISKGLRQPGNQAFSRGHLGTSKGPSADLQGPGRGLIHVGHHISHTGRVSTTNCSRALIHWEGSPIIRGSRGLCQLGPPQLGCPLDLMDLHINHTERVPTTTNCSRGPLYSLPPHLTSHAQVPWVSNRRRRSQ